MKKTYLIDSENINDIWVMLLHILGEKDEIAVFYTDNSAYMSYGKIVRILKQEQGALRWIKCFEGTNALDFQLVSELGHMLCGDGRREYVIVSNDTGYDVVVRYWQGRGYSVRRMKSTECETLCPSGEPGGENGAYPGRQFKKKSAEKARKAEKKKERERVRKERLLEEARARQEAQRLARAQEDEERRLREEQAVREERQKEAEKRAREEERQRQEKERRRQEEEKQRQEKERRRQEEEKQRQEKERRRQEEEKQRREKERQRQEEERRRQEEEKQRQEEEIREERRKLEAKMREESRRLEAEIREKEEMRLRARLQEEREQLEKRIRAEAEKRLKEEKERLEAEIREEKERLAEQRTGEERQRPKEEPKIEPEKPEREETGAGLWEPERGAAEARSWAEEKEEEKEETKEETKRRIEKEKAEEHGGPLREAERKKPGTEITRSREKAGEAAETKENRETEYAQEGEGTNTGGREEENPKKLERQEKERSEKRRGFFLEAEEDGFAGKKSIRARDGREPERFQRSLEAFFKKDGSGQPQEDEAFVEELGAVLDMENMALVNEALVYRFGQERGNRLYRFLKDGRAYREWLNRNYVARKEERKKRYLLAAMKHGGLRPEDIQPVWELLERFTGRNMDALHNAMTREFGQEQGSRYYAALRNHFRILEKM